MSPAAAVLLLCAAAVHVASGTYCFDPTANPLTSIPCTDDVVCARKGTPTAMKGGLSGALSLFDGGSLVLYAGADFSIAAPNGGCEDQFYCGNNNPCLNNGTCFSRAHRAVCICPPQYYGDRCEQVNSCSSKTVVLRGLVVAKERMDATAGCIVNRLCNASEIVVREPTATTDRICGPGVGCEAGTVVRDSGIVPVNIFDTDCIACPSGQHQPTNGFMGAACMNWTLCPMATYASTPPSASTEAICSPCPNGSYTHAPNLNLSCTIWSSTATDAKCQRDTRYFVPASNVSDNRCEDCKIYQFKDSDRPQFCINRSVCAPGYGRIGVRNDYAYRDGGCDDPTTQCKNSIKKRDCICPDGDTIIGCKPCEDGKGSDEYGFLCKTSTTSESAAQKAEQIILGTVGGSIGLLATIVSAIFGIRRCLKKKLLQRTAASKPPSRPMDASPIPNLAYLRAYSSVSGTQAWEA